MGKPKAPCGTDAAYRRHLREGVEPDEACRDAHAAIRRASRRSPAASAPGTKLAKPAEGAASGDTAGSDATDDMKLIIDTLRTAFVKIAQDDPARLAPISREFRTAVESVRGPVEPPKEMTLAEQLAEARAARAARAQSQDASA